MTLTEPFNISYAKQLSRTEFNNSHIIDFALHGLKDSLPCRLESSYLPFSTLKKLFYYGEFINLKLLYITSEITNRTTNYDMSQQLIYKLSCIPAYAVSMDLNNILFRSKYTTFSSSFHNYGLSLHDKKHWTVRLFIV